MFWLSFALGASSPHFSFPDLVTANGYGVFVWESDRLTVGYPHLYQEYTPGDVTPDLLYDSYFGWVDDGAGQWLTEVSAVRYEVGTNIIVAEREVDGLNVVEYSFAPMSYAGVALAQVVTVTNAGAETITDAQLVSLHNYQLGGTERASSPDAANLSESGDIATLSFYAPGASDAACQGVYASVGAGQTIGGGCNTEGADLVPGFGWRIAALAPGESMTFGVLTHDGSATWNADDPETWVAAALTDWEAWHSTNGRPALTADETDVWLQQAAFLRMAQVQESGDAFGQIAASLPVSAPVGDFEHIWNITWVRDGSYATAGLVALGRLDEAADSLRFMSQGKTGDFRSYVGGVDYLVSVCRMYGDGSEWSDINEDGPNVQFDNFGIYLWALGLLIEREDLIAELGPAALDGVADVLVGLIDPNTGLLQPDSSIWERHWNGNQQQFAYSSVQAVAGLTAAAAIAEQLGDSRATTYLDAADTIRAGVQAHLLDANGAIAASSEQLETGGDYLDLAAVEAFNHNILTPGGPEWQASVEAWERLRVASGHGYMRNDDGSLYDQHEWMVIDLRYAEAHRRACDPDEGARLETWLTDQAMLNNQTIPELMDPDNADYAGPAPMLGFGAGAYIWGLSQRDAIEAACEASAGLDSEDGSKTLGGCGCTAGTTPAGGALLFVLAALRRRR